jgi:hypothetical protein
MRGSIVVLALAVTPLVARVSNAQVRSHAVRHETPIVRHDDDRDKKSDDKKCEDRKRGNPSERGDERRADPRSKGNKDCDDQGSQQTPPPPAPAPAPVGHTSVAGQVFFDLDHDGMLGVDEVGLSGWTVQISGPVTLTTTTDGNGAYSFDGLNAGSYVVCVVPPAGWTQTAIANAPSCGTLLFGYTIDAAALAVDISYTGIDFGFVSN